jgi:hypothetical protein
MDYHGTSSKRIENRMLSVLWHVAFGHHALASCKLFSWPHNCYSARYAQNKATSWRAFAATMHPTVTWLDIVLILLLGIVKMIRI